MRRIHERLIRLAAVALTLATLGHVASAQRGGGGATCRSADSTSNAIIAGLIRIVTNTSPEVVAARQRMQLPAVPATSVTLVTNNTVCNKAEKPYTAAVGPAIAPSGQVYVVQVGTVYIVDDPVQIAGEWVISMTISSNKVLAKHTR